MSGRAAVVVILFAVLGCGRQLADVAARGPRLDTVEARRAAALAPDYFARAERARVSADRAADPRAAADHRVRARILLQAAIAEADRIALDRRRAAAEARVTRAEQARAALTREGAVLSARLRRLEAARAARAEAARVFAWLGSRRSGDRATREAARARAADFLRQRAALVLSAAEVLGARAPALEAQLDAARSALRQVERTPARGPARVAAAERALSLARSALGAARAALKTVPTRQEVDALVAAARERGWVAEPGPAGLAIVIEDVFAPGGAVPSEAGRRALELAAQLLRAHPHGPVVLSLVAQAGASASSRRRAERRAAAVRRILRGAVGGRIEIATSSAGADAPQRVRILLPAYAPLAEG